MPKCLKCGNTVHIELVVKMSKRLESILKHKFNASGGGLHETVTSVQSLLPEKTVKRLRYVATIRNKIIHEENYNRIDDRNGFKKTVDITTKELDEIMLPSSKTSESMMSSEKESKCFIATAVYESSSSHELLVLRKFRDQFLLNSKPSSLFVNTYYVLYPPLAKAISNSSRTKKALKFVLDPLVITIERKINFN